MSGFTIREHFQFNPWIKVENMNSDQSGFDFLVWFNLWFKPRIVLVIPGVSTNFVQKTFLSHT